MAAVAQQCEGKLAKLLDLFLSPQFQIKNDFYLNSLLSHFSGKENKELGEALLHLPVTARWIEKALAHSEIISAPPISISMFILNLTALLSKDESLFIYYSSTDVYKRLFKIFNMTSNTIPPTIKLAYVKILSAFIEHKPGLEWVISNEIWKVCLNFCLANETIYIIREGHIFVYNLLLKSSEVNVDFTNLIVSEILGKFNENLYDFNNTNFPEIEDEALQRKFRPTVNLIKYVLKEFWASDAYKAGKYQAVQCFIKDNNLELCVNKIIILTRNQQLLYDLYYILCQVAFYELIINTKSEIFQRDDLINIARKVFSFLSTLINNSDIINVIRLSHSLNSKWNLLNNRMPPSELKVNKEPILFQQQLVCFQILPVFGISFVHCNIKVKDIDDDDVRDAYIDDLFKVMCEDTIRLGYKYRTIIVEQSDAFDSGKKAIMYALKNIKNYNKWMGVKIFQICTYSLKDLNDLIVKMPNKIQMVKNNTGYCTVLLDLLEKFIAEFEITWRDSVETICVTANTIEFLNHNFWPPMVVVQGLKLVKLSIQRFLSPNLALLVESDSTNDILGTMLLAKLHDINWEVRDSALEIVHTIANISNTKYPSFQKMLMKLDILKLVVLMSINDSEGFVRASAIKCLQEMIQVQQFWKEVLAGQELPQKMMTILRNESEAIVRTEAASLMRYIHEHQSFPIQLMPEIYEAMSYAATSDLHWEVKSNALDFWGKVILNHLLYQGFLDGKFPKVTFSKENRKIVTLTETEIKARLNKVLEKLSENRCLSVLVAAIQDDCDLEVSKKSILKLKKLKRLMLSYNMISEDICSPPQSPISNVSMDSPPIVARNDISCDQIIDDIINTNDVNLLKSVYSPDFEQVQTGLKTNLKIVTPEMFLSFLRQDLDFIIEQRLQWFSKMDSLNSLLDDMLKSYDDDVNTMDCY